MLPMSPSKGLTKLLVISTLRVISPDVVIQGNRHLRYCRMHRTLVKCGLSLAAAYCKL